MGYLTELQGQKIGLELFLLRNRNIFQVLPFQFFFYMIFFTNNGRNLEIAESNPIMKNICSSLSLSVPSFFFSFTFFFSVTLSLSVSLCLTLSLSLSLSLSLFVYAALQLLLCGVILSSIILINAEL